MVNGVINVRKEKGMTSFGVVSRMRRIFDQKKIGHTGTLDPDAEGVLPVCMGRACRLVEMLSRTGTKTYEAVLFLGRTTDTQDLSGRVLSERPPETDARKIREAVLGFEGRQTQIPPMYSAVKVNGKKLVDLARRGVEVERPVREVEFSGIEILEIEPPRVRFRVTCTHGAYIRTLCHDIGGRLGCGASMESLVRTRSGEFVIEEAMTLDELRRAKAAWDTSGDGGPYPFLIPIDHFYRELSAVAVKNADFKKIMNGCGFPAESGCGAGEGDTVRAYGPDGHFLGIYRRRGDTFELVKFYADC